MPSKLTWQGPQVLDAIEARLIPAVDEITLRIAGEAKKELYPGHGKRTGTLQRSITTKPAQRRGTRIVGSVGSNIRYAKILHRRYKYITIGLQRVRPQALGIIRRHAGK